MKNKILIKALSKISIGMILLMMLIFIPAGSLSFINGWIFLGLLFIPMLAVGIFLMIKNPSLLEKRLNSKETESEQKVVLAINSFMFLAGFIVAGLDYRFSWFTLPEWMVICGCIVFLLSYVMYAEVLRENTYLSRTIEVQDNQKVIDTCLYGIVRHPMYSATIVMFLSIPVILGSVFSLLIFLIYPFTLVKRILNEEEFLEKNLEGYSEYKIKVRYRLIPFIW